MNDRSKKKVINKIKAFKKMMTFSLLIIISVIQLTKVTLADYATGTMLVSAVVKASCVVDAGSVQFGVYDPVGSNSRSSLNSASDINMKCVRGTTARVTIDAGKNAGHAKSTTRAMASTNSDAYLAYELYKDQNMKEIWDSKSPVIYQAETTKPAHVKVYGKIPNGQQVDDGTYTDMLTISVMY